MDVITANINWLATVAGAIAAFMLGWLWYSPKLFGAKWAAGVGIDLEETETLPVAAMTTQAAGTFLLAWTVGALMPLGGPVVVGLAVLSMICLLAAAGFFVRKSAYAIRTEIGFVAAMAVIMVAFQKIL